MHCTNKHKRICFFSERKIVHVKLLQDRENAYGFGVTGAKKQSGGRSGNRLLLFSTNQLILRQP